MASDFQMIPVIDVGPLLEKCNEFKMEQDPAVQEVVCQLDEACREAGLFYVKGHGISDSLIKHVKDATRTFFEMPYDEKVKIKMLPTNGFRGYQRIGENITKGTPDMHEAIDCYKEVKPGMYGILGKTMEGSNLWPQYPSNFKHLMEDYVDLLQDISRKIMRGIALALGGPVNTFEGQIAGDPFWVMRLIGYPGSNKSNQMQDDDIGCGAHTDYGLLTLVNQDDEITALQVMNKSGQWIDAIPIPGTFVCNIGDMLKVLSNGIYMPTLHRVINKSLKYRTSVAFFYEPNFDVPMEPLDFCKQRTGGVAKFEKVTYGEHLVSKVLTNFV